MKPFNYQDFLLLLTGADDWNFFWGGIAWSLFGFALSVGNHIKQGIKFNPNTPPRFDWNFFWTCNWFEIWLGYLFTLAAMRFSVEITGSEATMYLAFMYGLLNYRLGDFIGKRATALIALLDRIGDKINNLFKKRDEN